MLKKNECQVNSFSGIQWIRETVSFFFPNARSLYFLTALGIVLGATELVFPFLAQVSLDQVLPSGQLHTVLSFAGGVTAFYVLQWSLSFCHSYWTSTVTFERIREAAQRLYRNLLSQDALQADQNTMEKALRLESDLRLVLTGFLKCLDMWSRSLAVVAGGVVLLCGSDPLLLVLLAVFALFQALPARWIARRIRDESLELRALQGRILSLVFEHFSKRKTIQLHQAETYFSGLYDQECVRRVQIEKKLFWLRKTEWFFSEMTSYFYKLCIGLWVAFGWMQDAYSSGKALFVLFLLQKLQSAWIQGSGVFREIRHHEIAWSRIRKAMNPFASSGQTKIAWFHSLEFRNVHFSWPGKNVFSGLHFRIEEGEKVLFLGESGCGKSTLFHLILGLIQPSSGDVWVNGLSLREYDVQAWRSLWRALPQESDLFSLSPKENILLGRADLGEKEWMEFLTRMQLVGRLPDAKVWNEAAFFGDLQKFSHGEQKRLALARTFYEETPLWILDEPDAHLDEQTLARLEPVLFGGKSTVLIFTHRESWIPKATRVIRLPHSNL